MKPIRFLGDSLKRLREFAEDARHDAGYQLDKVQRGERPDDCKPMPSIGKGVEEIRVWDETGRTVWSTPRGSRMRFTCCMRSRRSPRRQSSAMSNWPGRVLSS
jgi:hypothetical protein